MTWENLVSYITANYKYEKGSGDIIKMVWTMDEGRSQIILVGNHNDWVQLYSPVGNVPPTLIGAALNVADDWMGGGLVSMGKGTEDVWVRTCSLLPSLSIEEFDTLMHATMKAADEIEKRVLGTDRY